MLKRSRATSQPVTYQIHVRGVLKPTWLQWFSSAEITPQSDGSIAITTSVDRSDLYYLLNRIRDLGLVLLAVQVVHTEVRVA